MVISRLSRLLHRDVLPAFFHDWHRQNTVYTIRSELFEKLHTLPIPFFDRRQQGEIMSRVTNDIDNVSNTLNTSIIQILSSVLTLIGTVSVMVYLSPLLALITMSIIPIMVFGMKWITSRTGPLYKIQQQRLGHLNGYVEETISGQRIIKTFSQEERVTDDLNKKMMTCGTQAIGQVRSLDSFRS